MDTPTAGITLTPPSSAPPITGPIPSNNPSSIGVLSVSVGSGIAVGTYSGTLTVTLGGVAYTDNPLSITVLPAVNQPTPSCTLSCTTDGANNSLSVAENNTVQAAVALTRLNGYAYFPVLSVGNTSSLPQGVTVTFNYSGTESPANYNVVTATISAGPTAIAGGPYPIVINSYDGVSSGTVPITVSLTVSAPPMSVWTRITYSGAGTNPCGSKYGSAK